MRLAIKYAYNGIKYHGFARQPNLKTIEGKIIDILISNNIIENPKKSVFRASSRTDKGVSALGNVIAFNTNISEKDVFEQLSEEYEDIIFYASASTSSEFYPRYAKLRQYRYYLNISNLDKDKIIESLPVFLGEHNFTNFARIEPGKNPFRTIENIVFEENNDFLIIDFYAQTFLWKQIRRIISSLIKIGNGKIDINYVKNAFENPHIALDFGVAPAEPLILMDVFYDFDFDKNQDQIKKLSDLKEKIKNNIIKS